MNGECYLCGFPNGNHDVSRSPGGLPNLGPGHDAECTKPGREPKPEFLRCLHCYVGYPSHKPDGTPWWKDNGTEGLLSEGMKALRMLQQEGFR